MSVELFWRYLKTRNTQIWVVRFLTKTLLNMLVHFFFKFRENCFRSQNTFISPVFFCWGKTAFTHSFTFQPCYLIILRWIQHIYLSLNQIWAQSEKGADWVSSFDDNAWATGGLGVNSTSGEGGLISFPLLLLEGNAILPTPKAGCNGGCQHSRVFRVFFFVNRANWTQIL